MGPKYDYSQDLANELLEDAENRNDKLQSELFEYQGKYEIAQATVDRLEKALAETERKWREQRDRANVLQGFGMA